MKLALTGESEGKRVRMKQQVMSLSKWMTEHERSRFHTRNIQHSLTEHFYVLTVFVIVTVVSFQVISFSSFGKVLCL